MDHKQGYQVSGSGHQEWNDIAIRTDMLEPDT